MGEVGPVSEYLLNDTYIDMGHICWVSWANAASTGPQHLQDQPQAQEVASAGSVSADGLWSPYGVGRLSKILVCTLLEVVHNVLLSKTASPKLQNIQSFKSYMEYL